MKAVVQIREPDAVKVNVTLTMTVGELRLLRSQLDRERHPSWPFAVLLAGIIQRAEEHFDGTDEINA